MPAHVVVEPCAAYEAASADVTDVRPVARVRRHVVRQAVRLDERLPADRAGVAPVAEVDLHVRRVRRPVAKALPAQFADDPHGLDSAVLFHVLVEGSYVTERLRAHRTFQASLIRESDFLSGNSQKYGLGIFSIVLVANQSLDSIFYEKQKKIRQIRSLKCSIFILRDIEKNSSKTKSS